MTRLSSPAILAALALAFAAPAFAAPTSVPTAEKLCKAAAAAQQPAPKSVRIDKDNTRADTRSFLMQLRVRTADGAAGVLQCEVDRVAGTASILTQPAPAALSASN